MRLGIGFAKDPIARGLAAQPPQWQPGPSVFHMWKRRIFSIFFGDSIYTFFCGLGSRKQASEVTVWTLAVEFSQISKER